jgi:hypothetical protein
LRDQGWTAEVVERWIPGANIRKDLFDIIDIIAIRGAETLAVQTTSAANVAARIHKIGDSPHVAAVREAGWLIHVHGWEKRRGRWMLARNIDVS